MQTSNCFKGRPFQLLEYHWQEGVALVLGGRAEPNYPSVTNKLAASSRPFWQVYDWGNVNGLESHQWHAVAQL